MRARLLIADDDPDTRELLCQALRAERYDCEAVEDGELALVAVRRHPPELLITDIDMPRLDGLALRLRLRREGFADLPILFISGGRHPMDLPGSWFVAKPFDLAEIVQAVRLCLKARDPDRHRADRGLPYAA